MSTELKGYPLSPQQSLIWSGRSQHWVGVVIQLQEPYRRETLQTGLAQVIQRHDSLRSHFLVPDHMTAPIQTIENAIGWQLFELDADTSWEAFMQNLEQDLRSVSDHPVTVLVSKAEDHEGPWQLVLCVNPLCADSVSLLNLAQEMVAEYAGTPLTEPVEGGVVQYAQYTQWLEELASESDTEARLFWQKAWKRDGDISRFAPADPKEKMTAQVPWTVSLERLRQFAERGGVSPESVLLGLWFMALAREFETDTPTIHCSFHGRSFDELRFAIGVFSRFLPLTMDYQPYRPFSRWILELEHLWQDTQEWQHHADIYQPADLVTGRFGFSLEPSWVDPASPNEILEILGLPLPFDCCLQIGLHQGHLRLAISGHPMVFKPAQLPSFAQRFARMAEFALTTPTAKLYQHSWLSAEELAQFLPSPFPPEPLPFQSLVGQVEVHATNIPNQPAIMADDGFLDYQTLNAYANTLAQELALRGMGPEVVVGLSMSRTTLYLVATLAVWKVGGTCLPLDPSLPTMRIAKMLTQTKAQLVLHDGPNPFEAESVPTMALSRAWFATRTSTPPPQRLELPQSLAYVIYTSGSTGTPKGVAITQQNLIHYLKSMTKQLALSQGESAFAQVSTLAADLGHTTLYGSLFLGGTLHLLNDETVRNSQVFAEYLERHPVDHLKITPSHLQALMAHPQPEKVLPRKTLILGGEAPSPQLLQALSQIPSKPSVYNHYGPSETTVGVLACLVNLDLKERPPLGRPSPGCQVLVLGRHFQARPVGLEGDFYLSGSQLGRGYIGNPALTAISFLPNPLTDQPGSRCYASGDRGWVDSQGFFHFAGRRDHQVKIRGFRVEFKEVEAILRMEEHVRAVVVDVWGPHQQSLIAYVEGPESLQTTLPEFAQDHLPSYMVPSHWVFMNQLPLNANGKLDRQALKNYQANDSHAFQPPTNPLQEKVCQLCQEVLELESVSVDRHFFELGGHSLNGTIIMARLNDAFGTAFRLADLFKNPTVTALAELLAGHFHWPMGGSQLTQSELAQFLRERNLRANQPAVPAPASDLAPLSYGQQRLWFLTRLLGPINAYNIPLYLKIKGPLQKEALDQAVGALVARHHILSSAIVEVEGKPFLKLLPNAWEGLQVIDIAHLSGPAQDQSLQELLHQEAHHRFDLAQKSLLRVRLIRLSDETHVFCWTIHHMASDAWSNGIVIREIAQLYRAACSGKQADLPPLERQYADYARDQRQWLSSEAAAQQLAFWKTMLEDVPQLLPLPTDRPRTAFSQYRGALHHFELSPSLAYGVETMAKRFGATPFMVLNAAFAMLLARFSGEEKLVVGIPVANRNQRGTESLIGFFINTLALPFDLGGDPRFTTFLELVKERSTAAYDHQDLPFEKVVEALHPNRNLNHNPLFQVVFTFQNTPQSQTDFAGLELTWVPLAHDTAKFDLTLNMQLSDRGLFGHFEYDSDLFDHVTIERMQRYFANILASVIAHPERSLSQHLGTPEEERHQLLHVWNTTEHSYPASTPLILRFEEHAMLHPLATALIAVDAHGSRQEVSYGKLRGRVHGMAAALCAKGVTPGQRVGLLAHRSCDLITGLLAILKAGATYVPLDPHYPQERIAYILQDADIKWLLTSQTLNLPESHTVQPLLMEALPEVAVADQVFQEIPLNLPAYVIYTSGSTGKPKGVVVTHQNAARLFDATNSWFSFGPEDTGVLFHSHAFDFSVWEIWAALAYGGTLLIPSYELTRTPEAFHELLEREKVTVLNQTPSALVRLIQAGNAKKRSIPSHLKTIVLGGERVDPESLRPWMEAPNCPEIVNMYGITETTVHVTYRPLTVNDLQRGTSVIGRSIPDLGTYVLDRFGYPAPQGVPGEIWVYGAGLAQGYLNRPALTAQRFTPNPFSTIPGDRMYKTGDLARYRSAHDLEYLGRNDDQIKIRGFRIELGEITACLKSHPAIGNAVTLLVEDDPHQPLLASYYQRANAETPDPDPAKLSAFLAQHLPDYMIPALWVAMDVLPLTSHGKVDLKALPAPSRAANPAAGEPITDFERAMVKIWSEVLGTHPLGIHDNFFALGGDSIRSMEVITKAKKLGFQLSIQGLFQSQTIHQLGKLQVLQARPWEQTPETEAFQFALANEPRDGIEDCFPLSQLQQGMLFHSLAVPDKALYHNVNTYRLEGPWHPEALEKALRQLMAEHAMLRTAFRLDRQGRWWQVVVPEVAPPLVVEDWRQHQAPDQAIASFIQHEKQNLFDLSQAPLFRCFMHRLDDRTFQFTLSEHHAILDGWSVAIFQARLFDTYSKYCKDAALPALIAPNHSFRSYFALEELTRQSEACQTFWRDQMHHLQPGTLPMLKPATHTFGTKGIAIPLEEHLSTDLQNLADALAVPIKSVLLAAHMKVLHMLLGSQDVVTGLVSNGRLEEAEGQNMLGLFLNTLPFRLRMAPTSWVDLIQQVFRQENACLPYRRFPLADIQSIAGLPSLFDVLFNFTHFHRYGELNPTDTLRLINSETFAPNSFPLTVNFGLTSGTGRLTLSLTFDPGRLDSDFVLRIGSWLRQTLRFMADRAEANHGYLPYPEPNASVDVVEKPPASGMFCQGFAERLRLNPNAPAIFDNGQTYCYQDVEDLANRVAQWLLKRGISTESIVLVDLPRSAAMITAMLGIWKAGAAYVTIDPGASPDRVSWMLEDTGARAVIGNLASDAHLAEHVLMLDLEHPGQSPALAGAPSNLPAIPHFPQQTAYIIYTSGSTGTPKGVAISHGALSHYLNWAVAAYASNDGTPVPMHGPVSFDATITSLWLPLQAGHPIRILGENHPIQDLAHLLFVDQPLDWIKLTPSHLDALALLAPKANSAIAAKTFVVGGEALTKRHVTFWQQHAPHLRIINEYGPTETVVGCCVHTVTGDEEDGGSLPIGKPLTGTRQVVVNAFLQDVPHGLEGQLVIGGPSLARGYHRRPRQTAAVFVPDPFGSQPGGRLYLTGDRACQEAHGSFRFLGRFDHQIKLHGYRIEPGAIETRLREFNGIRDALVQCLGKGDRRILVGFLLTQDALVPDSAELATFLASTLPHYMIPSQFLTLERWPLTGTGKIDLRLLEALHDRQDQPSIPVTPPETPTQVRVAAIWQEVLGRAAIPIHQPFFEAGGNSLLLVKVYVQLQEHFAVELALLDLFRHSTIAQIAQFIDQTQSADIPQQTEEPQTGNRDQLRRLRQRRNRTDGPNGDPT